MHGLAAATWRPSHCLRGSRCRLPAQERVGCCTDSAAAAALLQQAGNAYHARRNDTSQHASVNGVFRGGRSRGAARKSGRDRGVRSVQHFAYSATDRRHRFRATLCRRIGTRLPAQWRFAGSCLWPLCPCRGIRGGRQPVEVLAVSNNAFHLCAALRSCFFINQLFAVALPYAAGGDSAAGVLRRLVTNSLAQRDTVGWVALSVALGSVMIEQLGQYDSAHLYLRSVIERGLATRETLWEMGTVSSSWGCPTQPCFTSTFSCSMLVDSGTCAQKRTHWGTSNRACHRTAKPAVLVCAVTYYDSAASVASEVLRQAGQDINRVSYGEQAANVFRVDSRLA